MIRAFGLVALACGAHSQWVQQEPEVRPFSPEHSMWVLEKRAPAEHLVNLTVALKVEQGPRAQLEKVFNEVSDPQHERYGQHLSIDDVTKLLAIPQSRVAAVSAYFQGLGATSINVAPNKDMLTVTMPAASVEAALKTKLGFFSHSERSDRRIVRATTSYSLPAEMVEHIDLVGELLQFPRLRLKSLENLNSGKGSWRNECSASACKGLITPAVLAERYKLPGKDLSNAAGNSMSVAEFGKQYYKDSDLSTFSASCHRDVKVHKTIGGNQQIAGIEASLDIEYIKSVAPQVPLTVVHNMEGFLSWANQINSLADAPLINSVSYANDEIQQTSAAYMYTANTAFMKAGAKGLSILVAAGDNGVCGRSGCLIPPKFDAHARFHPDFPAGSPYVTAVGGTDFVGDSIGDEYAWEAGGGGFSDTFAIPEWQKAALSTYKASPDADLPPAKFWNNTGRGYPDIAALGGTKAAYCIATDGYFHGISGTSAATPVVGGVFALLNGLRLSAGKAPLGFLNPFIYQNPTAFNDVTSGVNDYFSEYGFKAIKGWDAATGLGTPDYEALSRVVMTGLLKEKGTSTVVV